MLYPALPPLGFIAAILVLIPLPRQIRVCNTATIALTSWLFGTSIISSVNAIVWAGNVNNSIPVWCDITSRFVIAATFGLPGATLCICKRLERVSSGRPVGSDTNRSRQIFEVILCFILPCFWIFVVYCFQTSRFIILENFGCNVLTFNSYIVDVVWLLPSLILAVGTVMFGCAAFYHLIRNHRMNAVLLASHLKSRQTSLSSVQYYRLMTVSMALGLWSLAWVSYYLQSVIVNGNYPLPDWNAIHSDYSTIVELPTILMTPGFITSQLALWWALPGGAYLYFFLFGTSREVLSDYREFWVWFRSGGLRQMAPVNLFVSKIRAGSAPTESLTTYVEVVTINDQGLKLPKEEQFSV